MNNNDLAVSIVNNLKQIIGDDSLWSIADIANYINLSKSTVSNRIVNNASFPDSIQIPYGSGSKTEKRWCPHEVKQWILNHRNPS